MMLGQVRKSKPARKAGAKSQIGPPDQAARSGVIWRAWRGKRKDAQRTAMAQKTETP